METKKCSKCTEIKLLSEFYKNKKSKDGLKCWCKTCHLEDSRKRESNYNETRRKYRLEHKDEFRSKKKKEYLDNKEKILNRNSKWQQTINGKLHSYKRAAKARGIEWKLTEDEFKSFWMIPCYYCHDEIKTIGIDRIDSSKAYMFNNCRPCCTTCNMMKMNLSEHEFILKIKQIAKHL